jgi:hypothetical protein
MFEAFSLEQIHRSKYSLNLHLNLIYFLIEQEAPEISISWKILKSLLLSMSRKTEIAKLNGWCQVTKVHFVMSSLKIFSFNFLKKCNCQFDFFSSILTRNDGERKNAGAITIWHNMVVSFYSSNYLKTS